MRPELIGRIDFALEVMPAGCLKKNCTYARARVVWRISRRKSGAKTSTVRHIS
jgi:hypothetical protein